MEADPLKATRRPARAVRASGKANEWLPFAGTPLETFMLEALRDTERRVATLRVWAGVVGVASGPWLAFSGSTPLLISPGAYVAVEVGLLVYAVIYRLWQPWRRNLRASARAVALLDLTVVMVIVVNNGGLANPFWGLGAAVVLVYIVRFDFSRREMALATLVVAGAIALSQALAPVPFGEFLSMSIGILLTLVLISAIGMILVRRERRAVERAFRAEVDAITRVINTVQHEVNNPLAVASGNMELLRMRQPVPPEDGPYLRRVEAALERIGVAVGRLRELHMDPAPQGEGPIGRYTLAPGSLEPDEEGAAPL